MENRFGPVRVTIENNLSILVPEGFVYSQNPEEIDPDGNYSETPKFVMVRARKNTTSKHFNRIFAERFKSSTFFTLIQSLENSFGGAEDLRSFDAQLILDMIYLSFEKQNIHLVNDRL